MSRLLRKETTVTEEVDDAITFSSQYETNVMNFLRSKYEGKCFEQCFIERIERITNLSPIKTSITEPGKGHFSATFDSHVRQFDSISKFKVINRREVIFGTGPNSLFIGSLQQPFDEMAVNNCFPVVINSLQSRYTAMKSQVVAIVKLFTCRTSRVCYQLTGEKPVDAIYKQMATHYMHTAQDLVTELRSVEARYADNLMFFKKIFYSFTEYKPLPSWAVGERKDLLEKIEMKHGEFIVRPLEQQAGDTMCNILRHAPEGYEVVHCDNIEVIKFLILKELCIMLRMLVECPVQYDGILEEQSQQNIWMLLRKHQQQ